MVDVVAVQAASYRISKVGTSGYQDLPDFLSNANEVSIDAMNLIVPHYGKIKAATDLLLPYVKTIPATFASGILALPDDYFGIISISMAAGGPVRELKTNQKGTNAVDTIRKPTVAAPKFTRENNEINILPNTITTGLNLTYFKIPDQVSITTTPVESDTDDYETVTAQTDYTWPERMGNLIIYLLVERLGGEMKQPILDEIARLGITTNLPIEPVQ